MVIDEAFRDRIRAFAEKEIRPVEMDIAAGKHDLRELLPKLVTEGLTRRTIPTAYGGEGADFADMIVILEELSRVSYGAAGLIQLGANLATEFVGKLGGEDVKSKYLPRAADGAMFAEALSEPHAGSALTDLSTVAESDDDGGYRISGLKCWVTYGHIADYIIMFVRFGASEGAKGIGAVIIDPRADGVKFEEPWATMANPNAASEAVIRLDDVRVDADDVLVVGNPRDSSGFKKLMSAYNTQRLGNAASSLGLMQGAFDAAVQHAESRNQFGKRISDFQGIQWKLADMAVKLESTRSMLYRACVESDDFGLPLPYYAGLAKIMANTACLEVTSEALQIFGGYGYRTDYPIEYRFRIARGQSLAGGSVEMQRNVIASMILGRSISQRD